MIKEDLAIIKADIYTWLGDLGVDHAEVGIERTSLEEFGDFSTNVALKYARPLSQSPVQIAKNLADFLKTKNYDFIAGIDAVAPGFINFTLNQKALANQIKTINSKEESFGINQIHQDEKWVIEHSSPNPNKAMHLGHLRNNLVGMSLVNLLKFSGAEVKSDAVYNNRGIAIAKNMYGYLAHMKKNSSLPTDINYWFDHQDEWLLPVDKGITPAKFVTECYVLGEQDFSESAEVESMVRQMVIDWEAEDKKVWALWHKVLGFAYDGMDQTLKRLNNHFDKIWYEHEHYQAGKDYVEAGLEKGLFKKLPDGAVLTDLENNYRLPETILLKKDGTSLYITQDIALTDLKKREYNADRLVWVVGPEQSLALKQLFAVCEQLGIGKLNDFTHIAYGYVGIKDADGNYQKMSSRKGTTLFVDDFIDEVKASIKNRFVEEGKHDEKTREELAETLALGAVKFALLKSDNSLDLAFDINEAVDVQGDTGMYVLYTYVRTQSIIRKASGKKADSLIPNESGEERSLVRTLLYFEQVVEKSIEDMSVHHISQYLLELSSEFNSWYAKETVLDGGDREFYKLNLVSAVAITIKNGLAILGIKTVDQM
jgi:arginyl-tRNA synthetase